MKEKSESISFMRKSDTLLTQVVLPGVTMKTRNDVTPGAEGVQVSFFHRRLRDGVLTEEKKIILLRVGLW